jgi:hypothetical protein
MSLLSLNNNYGENHVLRPYNKQHWAVLEFDSNRKFLVILMLSTDSDTL